MLEKKVQSITANIQVFEVGRGLITGDAVRTGMDAPKEGIVVSTSVLGATDSDPPAPSTDGDELCTMVGT
jgi:hypothetical protein